MGTLSVKLRSMGLESGRGLAWWCPGCEELHVVSLDGPLRPGGVNCGPWSWNGDALAPTFSPSVNVRPDGWDPLDPHHALGRCHAVITGGMIAFCSDCQHALVGKCVPMPDLPPWHRDSDDPAYRDWLRRTHPDTWAWCFGGQE